MARVPLLLFWKKCEKLPIRFDSSAEPKLTDNLSNLGFELLLHIPAWVVCRVNLDREC